MIEHGRGNNTWDILICTLQYIGTEKGIDHGTGTAGCLMDHGRFNESEQCSLRNMMLEDFLTPVG